MNRELETNKDLFGPRPEVDAHTFAIHHLSMSPEGFLLTTDNLLPKQSPHLDASEKSRLGEAVRREINFNNAQTVRDARDAWKTNPDDPMLEAAFYDARADYQKKGKKLGLRNLRVEDGVIHTDVQIVHFPAYTTFGSPEQSVDIDRMSRLVGVAMVVRTADDRLVIQHRAIEQQHLRETRRSRGNAVYSDIPGASVAGMIDASLVSPDRRRGMPDPIDTDDVHQAIYKEAGEELGLAPTDFTSVRITGVAEDKIKVHDELLMLADTPLTAAELDEASRTSNRNKNLGDADFEEKFFDIEASPEAISHLLTEVKCPLPPTHAASLVAAGFSLALEQKGADYALAWRDQIEQGLRDNYNAIDALVADYYQKFPEALQLAPERYWNRAVPPRNPNGYDPAYGPEEQGLPNFQDAMVEAGLLPETRERVHTAYLFDVDGPLSDPKERKIVEFELVDELVARLRKGEPIAFNSGRSVEWIEKEVVPHIVEAIGDDKKLLERFVIIGEKGGSWLTFDEGGEALKGNVNTIIIPDDLRQEIHGLIGEKYADCVADLDPKTTMVSLEMLPGFDHEQFVARQKDMVQDLRALLQRQGLDQIFSIDATTIAVDIESAHVGKHIGADRFLQHLSDLGVTADRFQTFGDSASDVAMADELVRRGQNAEFIYVGTTPLPDQDHYRVVNAGNFSRGTLDFLKTS